MRVLTNLSKGGHKDPERDDEGDLHSFKLHVKDVILRRVSMVGLASVVSQLGEGVLVTVFK